MTSPRVIELEEIRCSRCKRLLLKLERSALKEGKLLEVKCGACNAYCTKIGDERDSQKQS